MQVNSISPNQQTAFGALKFNSDKVKASLLNRLTREEKVELETLIEGQKKIGRAHV